MNVRTVFFASLLLSGVSCTAIAYAATGTDGTVPSPGKAKSSPHKKPPGKGQAPDRHAADVASAGAGEAVIVTGTHTVNRKARDSNSPITIVSSAMLRRSGMLNLGDALTRVDPSINVDAMGTSVSGLTSAIRMRGLNPNEVLVLVDGKRRHTTAGISGDAGPNFGSTPVDLNMIPAGAIDHIEVLEDGAAAMYGSDAIAGVVNIITKKTAHGLNMDAQTGANAYNGDGWQYLYGVDGGTSLGTDGYLHVSGQMYHTDHMLPKTTDHRLLSYAPPGAYTAGNYTGPENVPLDSNHFTSTPEETRENLSIEFGKKITDGIEAYGLITYAHRHSEAYQNYRIPSVAPSLFPYGFSPLMTNNENDYSALLGIRGANLLGFDWDLSTVYGADEMTIGVKDTVNTGMLSATCVSASVDPTSPYASEEGCGSSPTTVRSERFRMAQWTNNFDMRRTINIAHTVPMTLALGAEHRLETYQIWPGQPASYQLGGVQGFGGLSPQNAGSWGRDVWAGYMDGDFRLTRKWDLDFAGRFEHYTDVGNTENGKISTRYQIVPRLALRATISNGFRAPTLAEQHYSSFTSSPTGGSGLLAVDSSAARLLGAAALKPERSTNVSGGFVAEPIDGLHVETDVYQIDLRDRIVQGGTVNGDLAVEAVRDFGFTIPQGNGVTSSGVTASYMANGASTRTQGLDIKVDYTFHLHQYGNLNLSGSLDLNRTRLHHNGVGTNGEPYLTAANIANITTDFPRSKLILNAFWTLGNWDVNVRQTRYGETTDMLQYMDWATGTCPDGTSKQFSNSCFGQFKNTPRWLTDIEVGYQVTPRLHVAVGANNVFNIRPRRLPDDLNYAGGQIYDYTAAQVPITGGYYYGRVRLTF
jgi:iron complex outermembrane recepter protein